MSPAAPLLSHWVRAVTRRMRVRRGLVAAASVAATLCAIAAFPPLVRWIGAEPPWWWSGVQLALVGWSAVAVAFLLGLLLPLATRRAVALADRRSRCDGSLVAAFESIGADEPLHRLLVRRTAERVGSIAVRQVLPLSRCWVAAATSLAVLLALGATLPARATPEAVDAIARARSIGSLSSRLREAAVLVLADMEVPVAERAALARHLLEVDARLLSGTIGSEDARGTLASLADRRGQKYARARSAGPRAAPGDGAAAGTPRELAPLDSDERHASSRTGTGGLGEGRGPGAGAGAAGLRRLHAVSALAVAGAAADWTLPVAVGADASARGEAPGRDGGVDPDATLDLPSGMLRPVERMLTREERTVVEAFFELVQREELRRSTAERRQRR